MRMRIPQGLKPALTMQPYAALKRRSSTVLHADGTTRIGEFLSKL